MKSNNKFDIKDNKKNNHRRKIKHTYFKYPTCSLEPNGVTEELKERRLKK